MRPARQFIVGDLISGIFDLFLTTYRRSTSIHVHSFLPSRWGRLRLFPDHPLGGRGRCRAGPDGSSYKHLRGLIALPRVASIRNRVSRVLCHHNLYLESEPLDVAYVLQHSYEMDGCEETKFIRVYRSREAADLAMQRLRPTPGFRDHPNGFSIDE